MTDGRAPTLVIADEIPAWNADPSLWRCGPLPYGLPGDGGDLPTGALGTPLLGPPHETQFVTVAP